MATAILVLLSPPNTSTTIDPTVQHCIHCDSAPTLLVHFTTFRDPTFLVSADH